MLTCLKEKGKKSCHLPCSMFYNYSSYYLVSLDIIQLIGAVFKQLTQKTIKFL